MSTLNEERVLRFSVYIPVWNGADWLDGAIGSVLTQTNEDWELVIGDNASTDETGEIAARYTDSRIRYQRWDEFAEIAENYNRTLLRCTGEWLQGIGVDDRLDPRCLELMADRIDRAAAGGRMLAMVVTTCRRVDPVDRGERAHEDPRGPDLTRLPDDARPLDGRER